MQELIEIMINTDDRNSFCYVIKVGSMASLSGLYTRQTGCGQCTTNLLNDESDNQNPNDGEYDLKPSYLGCI